MPEEKKPEPRRVPPPLPPNRAPSRPQVSRPAVPPMPARPAPQARPQLPASPARKPAPAPSDPEREQLSSEIDDMRHQMDSQIIELQKQLQEEREKLLLQTVRAKEEEAMASKVEESLKDIQDRLRREKREQELLEQLSKADAQVKELEQRVANERQTWVETLKTQLSQREGQEKELEHTFELKLKELERRWHEEKLGWSHAIKNKEEDAIKLKREFELAVANERDGSEKNMSHLESERDSLKRELKDVQDARQEERANLISKLEARDREYLSIKAQQAMVVTQMRQDKEKAEQLHQLLEKMRAEKNNAATQIEAKDKEYFILKTQLALYQTRTKSETEKLLKELVLYKEQMQKERQQWEMSIKSEQEETNLLARTAQQRELELKQVIEKKELEINALGQRHEERMRAREAELENTFGRKEAEYRAEIQRSGDILKVKESELKGRETQLSEIIQRKDSELGGWMAKERDWSIAKVCLEQKIRELEDKISALTQSQALERERTAQKENALNTLITQKENELKSAQERIGTQERLYKEEHNRGAAVMSEKDKKIDELSRESERSRNENTVKETALVIEKERAAQKENELKNAQEHIQNQAQIHREDQNRGAALSAQKDKKIDELFRELTQSRNENSGRESTLIIERERAAQKENALNAAVANKENELKNTQARMIEQERLHRESYVRLEEQSAQKDKKVDYAAMELAQAQREISGRESLLAAERAQHDAAIGAMKNEILKFSEKEKTYLVEVERAGENLRKMEESLRALSAEKQHEAANAAAKEREIITIKEQFERERRELISRVEAAEKELKSAATARDADIHAIRSQHDEERRGAETLRQGMQSELNRLKGEIHASESEIERMKNEIMLKEKDHQIEAGRRESAYKVELAQAEEKNRLTVNELRSKEDHAGKLKAREESLMREIENISSERRDAEAKLHARVESTEEKAHKDFEDMKARLRAKDEEFYKLTLSKQSSEQQLKDAFEQKYRHEIERFAVEKKGLAQSLSAEAELHASTRQELYEAQQHRARERKELADILKEKETNLLNIQRELDELREHMAQEMDAAEESRKLLSEDNDKLKIQYDQSCKELREIIEKSAPAYELAEHEPDQSFVIPVPQPGSFNNNEEIEHREMRSLVGRLWSYLNEPVYEKKFGNEE